MTRHWTVFLLVLLGVSGCSTFTIPRYGLSAENITAMRKLSQKVTVGSFTATPPGRTEISCRGRGPVKTPDGRSFEDYIRRALIDELKVAEVLADGARVSLAGTLGKLDFNSMRGEWTMDLTVTSSNGRSLAVSSTYDYKTGPAMTFAVWGGQAAADERACAETAQAFVPGVQVLIGKVVHHAELATLLE